MINIAAPAISIFTRSPSLEKQVNQELNQPDRKKHRSYKLLICGYSTEFHGISSSRETRTKLSKLTGYNKPQRHLKQKGTREVLVVHESVVSPVDTFHARIDSNHETVYIYDAIP